MGTASEKKRMGRPPTGRNRSGVTTRFDIATIAAIYAWAAEQRIDRGEAIRRLVELGLKGLNQSANEWIDGNDPQLGAKRKAAPDGKAKR
jgi:hypothetical protein